MNAEYIWLSLTSLSRIFYLAMICAVLWVKGYLWAIFFISVLCLFGNLFFAVPLALDRIQYARSLLIHDDFQKFKSSDSKNT